MTESPNGAEAQAESTLAELKAHLDAERPFKLEAGAGAGKTHSLIECLKHLTIHRGDELLREGRLVACITYTNVATDEIRKRTDSHPAIFASTIHSFCWECCKPFQKYLRPQLPSLGKWPERLKNAPGWESRSVTYDLGYPSAKPGESHVSLGHDDVLEIFAKLLERPKFRTLLAGRFPVIFVDEYQDTHKTVVDALERYLLAEPGGPILGLFGDEWQKIYGHGCGAVGNPHLGQVSLRSNFRSSEGVVATLNRMRPGLGQIGTGRNVARAVAVFHSNGWSGARGTGQFKDDLLEEQVRNCILTAKRRLEASGWDFSTKSSKVLMLTHKALAREQSYSEIVESFNGSSSTNRWHAKEDPVIAFLVDSVLTARDHYRANRTGAMLNALKVPRKSIDKARWKRELEAVFSLVESGSIGAVLDRIETGGLVPIPERTLRALEAHRKDPNHSDDYLDLGRLMAAQCQEAVNLKAFIEDQSVYATKHGVKGAEFDDVLVVFGRGWNHYDWSKFLSTDPGALNDKERESYERNRNLFYVACSRPRNRLAAVFTQKLSLEALRKVEDWFGRDNVLDIGGGDGG